MPLKFYSLLFIGLKPGNLTMPDKVIHIFRHAEAYHNSTDNMEIRDPVLTSSGVEQSLIITRRYNFLNRPTLILTSPLRRCIETALYAFHPIFNPNVTKHFPQPPRILAMPHLQETTEKPCDIGSSLDLLIKEYRGQVEFEDGFFASEDWFTKSGTKFANDNLLLSKRAEFVRNFILQQSDREIIVVTHADFSHFLVNRWLYSPGCGSLFDGLAHASGVPMILVEGESSHEMRVEIPPWFDVAEVNGTAPKES
jgi:broad specificity phosphatase PhoE